MVIVQKLFSHIRDYNSIASVMKKKMILKINISVCERPVLVQQKEPQNEASPNLYFV